MTLQCIAIVNIGEVLSGDYQNPTLANVDTVVSRDGHIVGIGRRDELGSDVDSADLLIDAQGATLAPGLIDSHCHVVLGDYTPRQKTVDFLASYVHGGITSVVSPGEIHAPGRPHEAIGVKSLAIAAKYCFDNFRPGGMVVHAGAVVLEPTLQESDFRDLEEAGVKLAKFGFGKYSDPYDGVKQVRWAQEHGIIVMSHSGGASIPGSQPITPDHLMALSPDVCGHINGGPTALDAHGVDRIMAESTMALQIVQAGNLKSAIRIVEKAHRDGIFHRISIGSDTPTGTGVMPLGVLKTVAELSSFTGLSPAMIWAAATGNNARIWELEEGKITLDAPSNLVIMDAPWGSTADTALGALGVGDIPGISTVITEGTIAGLVSRNTPRAARIATIERGTPQFVN